VRLIDHTLYVELVVTVIIMVDFILKKESDFHLWAFK